MAKRGFTCTKILLEGGTSDSDHKFLDIAPTMKKITHQGKTYFRCPHSRGQDPADGEWGMMYLWDGWMDWKLKQMKAGESKASAPKVIQRELLPGDVPAATKDKVIQVMEGGK